MREILRDFRYAQTAPMHIYEDNLACVAMSENPVRRKFSRHIDMRRYFVRDMVAAGVIKLVPLRTHLMVADALTESLPSPANIKHRDIMLGHVPFSFAARTLRNFIGGGGLMFPLSLSLSLSTCCDRGSLSCGDRGSFFYHEKFSWCPLHLCRIVVGKGESDKGDFMSRSRSLYCHSDTGPTALILRD